MELVSCRSGVSLLEQAETAEAKKAELPVGRSFILSMLAGMMIGMGATFMLLVKSDASLSFAVSQVLGGVCFSLGLICVIIAGAELFTGNTLMVAAACDKRCAWPAMLKSWAVVYLGNLIGSLLLVGIMLGANFAGMNGGSVGDAIVNVAYSKVSLAPTAIFFRGIMCNWLVCLAVWMGFAGRTVIDKIFTTIFPVAAFVACGFEHCVANMFFLPMGIAVLWTSGYSGSVEMATIMQVLTLSGAAYNIALATVGNIVGGALLVAMMYWLAYREKKSMKERSRL